MKKIIKNIRWAIFNDPPVSITRTTKYTSCSYCEGKANWVFPDFAICYRCLKKALGEVLGDKL